MTTLSSRRATFESLDQNPFDLLVIGGGITGAGVARDAAMRGLSVALVEKSDFGAGTSSKSSKLIHGGLRYLQHAEFGLVFEAVSERTLLLRMAPHLVRPLSFLVPSYKGQVPGLFTMDCGLWIYDALSKFASPKRHHTFRKSQVLGLEPGLLGESLRGGIVYYDSMTDDARLTLENVIDARAHGATVAPYAEVTRLIFDPSGPQSGQSQPGQSQPGQPGQPGQNGQNGQNGQPEGPIRGAVVRDVLDPSLHATIKARVTVNATGPWSDFILSLLGPGPRPAQILRPTKGVHVVLDAARLPVRHAVVMMSPRDDRVLFAIPWSMDSGDSGAAGRTVVGTTDTDYQGDLDQVAADAADIEYLLSCANHYFPAAHLDPGDVLSTWAGLRPLVAPPDKADLSASAVSREHRILQRPGLLTIAGGKLTTYRRMAAQVVDAVLPELGKNARELPCPTGASPLPGAQGLPARRPKEDPLVGLIQRLIEQKLPGVDEHVAGHLCRTYGTRTAELADRLQVDPSARERLDPELPYLMAEVDLAIEQEEALRLDDVLSRRLPLLLRGRDQGLGCAERVARRMGARLGWSDARRDGEIADYQNVVGLSRRFRRFDQG